MRRPGALPPFLPRAFLAAIAVALCSGMEDNPIYMSDDDFEAHLEKLPRVEAIAWAVKRGKHAENEALRWKHLAEDISKDVRVTGERWAKEKADIRRAELYGGTNSREAALLGVGHGRGAGAAGSGGGIGGDVDEDREAGRFQQAHDMYTKYSAKLQQDEKRLRTLEDRTAKQKTAAGYAQGKAAEARDSQAKAVAEAARTKTAAVEAADKWAQASKQIAAMAQKESEAHKVSMEQVGQPVVEVASGSGSGSDEPD